VLGFISRSRLALLAALLWLILPPRLANARPSDEAIARLRREVQQVLDQTGVPGVGLALVDRDGVIWVGGVGEAERASEARPARPVTADTVFRVGSITKSFIALAVAQLHERGELDLDAPVGGLLPDVEIPNRYDRPVTLGHALEHTAGFDDMHFNETFAGLEAERMPLSEVLALNVNSRRVRWMPGTRHAYANPGYTIAAAGLEAVTGKPFEQVVGTQIMDPLGIRPWSFQLDARVRGQLAQGYVGPNTPTPYRAIYHRPAGSLMLSPRQLAKFVHFWLTRGASAPGVASTATLARIERNGTIRAELTDVEYALGNYADTFHGVLSRGHDGGLPGFLSCYRYIPDLGVGYVVLLNSTHPGAGPAYIRIRQLLFRALVDPSTLPPPPEAEPEADVSRYAGYYEFASPRHEIAAFADRLVLGMVVESEGDRLFARWAGQRFPLVPTGPGRFRLPGQGATTIVFTDVDSKPSLRFHTLHFERGSATYAWLRRVGLQRSIDLLKLSVVLWVLAFLLAAVTRRRERPWVRLGELLVLSPPAAASLVFWAFVLVLQGLTYEEAGQMTPRTVAIFGLSLAFAATSAVATAFSLRMLAADRDAVVARRPFKLYATVASLSALGLTLYGTVNHIVGLRTWSW
jgi:CubicO group peptidase (beta-lactamase class C family)